MRRPVVVDQLRWRRHMCCRGVRLSARPHSRLIKVTLVSAQQAAAYYEQEKSSGAYATRDAYLADLVDFTRREIEELGRLGCEYVQIDAPQYAALLDDTIREGYRQRGSDPASMIDACIELDNAIIDGHAGITFGLHICRGNYRACSTPRAATTGSPSRCSAGPASHRFLLEFDDERSGTFEPLRDITDDRIVVLGLVSSKKPRMESRASCRGRIAEASRIVPLDRLALSSQCGFASTAEGNRLTADDQRAKLEVVTSAARALWPAS